MGPSFSLEKARLHHRSPGEPGGGWELSNESCWAGGRSWGLPGLTLPKQNRFQTARRTRKAQIARCTGGAGEQGKAGSHGLRPRASRRERRQRPGHAITSCKTTQVMESHLHPCSTPCPRQRTRPGAQPCPSAGLAPSWALWPPTAASPGPSGSSPGRACQLCGVYDSRRSRWILSCYKNGSFYSQFPGLGLVPTAWPGWIPCRMVMGWIG